ncbi:MAG: septation protein SpoVG family protein [Candidatus Omnitrophica bacterium]|nr:septation protein SpoVG family protein [Candidatus Omnitrophota bacterium]
MEVTEVRVFLRNKDSNKKLKAYVTVTFDNCFVVRDVKVIEGSKGLFVAMPSSKMKITCSHCGHRNVVRSKFCNQCGTTVEQLSKPSATPEEARQTEHKDIAHPITPECREYIQKKVLEAYEEDAAKAPHDNALEKAEHDSLSGDGTSTASDLE